MEHDVLVVGQTPPPFNGQSISIQELLSGDYKSLRLHHVPLSFSRELHEVGSFQIRKVLMLPTTIIRIAIGRWKSGATILYYPPAPPLLIPVIRDMVLLIATRWMFQQTVFHFLAAGLPEIYLRLPALLRPLYRLAYLDPDLAICPTASTSSSGSELRAKSIRIVPLGSPDCAANEPPDRKRPGTVPCILYVGLLCEGKGLMTLIEACALMHKANLAFRVVCVGAASPASFQAEMEGVIAAHGMEGLFHFPGLLRGDDKWQSFRDADIFCFASHYQAESFGVVLVEAMSFGLPIVTTRWRGIPDVVGGSGGAFVVEPKSPEQFAQSCQTLLLDPDLRVAMGTRNRDYFSKNYTIEMYRNKMEMAMMEMADC